jgi:hypothetical protein
MFDVVELLIIIMLAICIIGIAFCLVIIIKSEVTFRHNVKIINAICNYALYCIDNSMEQLVDYDDMRSFDASMYRLFDWGYKHVLPKEKFEIIKPFILESKCPECYGKPNTPNGMAENGCEDCEYARMCEVKRKVAELHEDC